MALVLDLLLLHPKYTALQQEVVGAADDILIQFYKENRHGRLRAVSRFKLLRIHSCFLWKFGCIGRCKSQYAKFRSILRFARSLAKGICAKM